MKEYYVYKVDGGYLGIGASYNVGWNQVNRLQVLPTPERALKFKIEARHSFDSINIESTHYIGSNDKWNKINTDLVERAVKVKIKEWYSFEEVEK